MRSTSFSRLKLTLTTLLFVLTLSLLTACGGSKNNTSSNTGNNGGSNSGTTGGSNPGNTGGSGGSGGSGQSAATFVYVVNNGPKQLQAFSFNGNAFTAIQGNPYAIGSFTGTAAIAGNTLFASAEGGNKVWTIDPNSGALTPVPTTSTRGWGIAYGNNVYGSSPEGITAYSVSNGNFTQIGSPVSVANLCADCTGYPSEVSKDGNYVFVMLSGFHDVNGFAVLNRASDGSISNARIVPSVNGSTSASAAVVVSNDNRYIYEFTQSGTIALWQFDPAAAKATQVTFTAATPAGIVDQAKISPDGKYLAAVSPGVNRIDMFSINASTGALTPVPGAPFATGTNPTRLAFSADSQTLFVDCRGDGSADLFAYHIGADGSLTQVAHQSLGGDPSSIAVK